jgi:hypothetical protein
MGDEQLGFLVAFPDAEQHFLHQHAGRIIQRTEWLVEQILEGRGDSRALLDAAEELLRRVILKAR